MKVIDLLNKIANGEEPPNFEYYGGIYKYDKHTGNYWCKDMWFDFSTFEHLNDEVEIIEEEPYVEICGSWFTKSEYDKLFLEEEKKIPEKLNWKPKESMAGQLIQKEQIEVISRRTEKLKKEFNNLLDYLKSKGE